MSAANTARLLQHDGIFYADEFDFVTAAVPFVREGVDAGEIVMVNTGVNPITPLLRAMFGAEEQVVIADRPIYSTPAGALDGYRRTMERGLAQGARGYRAIGFIDFESSTLPWQEWVRYEAAVNRVFDDLPFRTLCPYDTSKVPAEITDPMMRAHAGLYGPDGRHPNDEYVAPEDLLLRPELASPPHPLQSTAPRMVLEPDDDLMELRLELYAGTMFTGLPRWKLDDFVKAAAEVVTNAHKHGRAPVQLKLWASDATVVCEVTDQGLGITDPLAGFAHPQDPSDGLGLWAARQLCDVLDYAHRPEGFTVRVASFA